MAKKLVKSPVVWSDRDGCMGCKFCYYSPYDDPYCIEPKAAPKARWPIGRGINSALKVCRVDGMLTLREPRA